MGIVEGPEVTGTFGEDDHGDDQGVRPGDTVRIAAPGEPLNGVVGVLLDVVAVLPPGAAMPYLVSHGNVEKV